MTQHHNSEDLNLLNTAVMCPSSVLIIVFVQKCKVKGKLIPVHN